VVWWFGGLVVWWFGGLWFGYWKNVFIYLGYFYVVHLDGLFVG